MMKTILATVMAFSATAACTGTADEELTFEADGGKGDGDIVRPVGTFRRTDPTPGPRFLLLDESRHYEATVLLDDCVPAECDWWTIGTYKFASSNGKPYVVLFEDDVRVLSYEYELGDGSLSLRETGTTSWFTLTQEPGDLVLSEDDNGGTFAVTAGANVVVSLPSESKTGYKWRVVSTDRSFGYPAETIEPGTGDETTTHLAWMTSGPFPLTGKHTVKLAYGGGGPIDLPVDTFEFTVEINQ